jgi:hypothetical protein
MGQDMAAAEPAIREAEDGFAEAEAAMRTGLDLCGDIHAV